MSDIVSFAQVGLPFRRIEGTVVEWDEYAGLAIDLAPFSAILCRCPAPAHAAPLSPRRIRFDVRLMQRVPVRRRSSPPLPLVGGLLEENCARAHPSPLPLSDRSTRASRG